MNASMAVVGAQSAAAVKVQRPSLTRSLTPVVKAARPARSTVVRAAAVPEMVPDMAKRVGPPPGLSTKEGLCGRVWIRKGHRPRSWKTHPFALWQLVAVTIGVEMSEMDIIWYN
jgi:hypothetical protein